MNCIRKVATLVFALAFISSAQAQDNLSAADQKRIIEKVRERARAYVALGWGKEFRMIAAFTGTVFVDGETGDVLRITDSPSGIPGNWPIETVSESVDYTFVDVDGQQIFCRRMQRQPSNSVMEVHSATRSSLANTADFQALRY